MKKEIIIAFLYIVLIAITKKINIISPVFLSLSIFPISILLIIWGLKDFSINNHKITQIFSIYYKILLYIAVMFVAQQYPGYKFILLFASFFALAFLVVILIKGFERKDIINTFLYLNISAFIMFLLSR